MCCVMYCLPRLQWPTRAKHDTTVHRTVVVVLVVVVGEKKTAAATAATTQSKRKKHHQDTIPLNWAELKEPFLWKEPEVPSLRDVHKDWKGQKETTASLGFSSKTKHQAVGMGDREGELNQSKPFYGAVEECDWWKRSQWSSSCPMRSAQEE